MASKDPSKLYSILDSMRSDMEGLLQSAQEMSNEIASYGGILNSVLKEQLIKYYAPTIKNLIDGEETPGSIVAMVRFLDSLPLGSIRQQPSLDDAVAPIAPESKELDMPAGSTNPVDEVPQNASYQNQPENPAPVVESLNHKIKETAESGTPWTEYWDNCYMPCEHCGKPVYAHDEDEEGMAECGYCGWPTRSKVIEDWYNSHNHMNESIEKYQVVRLMNNDTTLPKDMVDFKDEIIDEFDNKEDAEARAELLNSSLLPEETEVFGTKYEVKKVEIDLPETEKVDEKAIEKDMPKAKKLPK